MTLNFSKATKAASHLRMALCGGPGAGKTWTSLAIATGLGNMIALLDTEHGSARKYASDFDFDVCELESFHPQHYIDGMVAAYNGGYDVLVIDSLSHAWAGKDGALELVDQARGAGNNNQFTAWRQVTPLQHQLIDTMLRLPMHLLVTMRTKVAYVVEPDDRGRQVPRKIGMAPIQREGCEYEFDVIGDLNNGTLTITKSRLHFLQGLVLEPNPQDLIAPGQALGQQIAADLGAEQNTPATAPATNSPVQQVTNEDLKRLFRLIRQYKADEDAFRAYLAGLGLQSSKELTPDQLATCLTEIETWKEDAFWSHDESESDTDETTIRAMLQFDLNKLQGELAKAEQSQPAGEPHAQELMDLAQWVSRVARDCENPNTPKTQLQAHLADVTESIQNLQELNAEATPA